MAAPAAPVNPAPTSGPSSGPKGAPVFRGRTKSQAIGTQVQLPFSKALEISLKSVKIRFWRSLITALGIVLAITFFMATLARGKTVEAMKAGLPAKIRAEQVSLGAKSTATRKMLTDLCAAGQPLEKAPNAERIRSTLDGAEYAASLSLLDAELDANAPARAHSGVQNTRAELVLLRDQSEYVKSLRQIRQTLLSQGETFDAEGVLPDETEVSAAPKPGDVKIDEKTRAAQKARAQKDRGEAQSRDRWLMALALLVSFVGIMNAMLMSVTERYREIGTMKCLGALDTFIMKLFLIESSLQGFLGTTAGIIFGMLVTLLKLTWEFGFSMWSFLPWGGMDGIFMWMLIALGVGTLLSVAGALYPAWVAARMEPVVAMRVDQ